MKDYAKLDEFSAGVGRELWGMIAGLELGRGIARRVFEHHLDRSMVVKVEDGAQSFQNIAEWMVWQAVKDTKWACWFAPCVDISPSGAILMMKRTRLPGVTDWPDRLPSFITDIKRANFGMFENRFVAHDYGTVPMVMLGQGMTSRTRKVEWPRE